MPRQDEHSFSPFVGLVTDGCQSHQITHNCYFANPSIIIELITSIKALLIILGAQLYLPISCRFQTRFLRPG